jgi:hypothetical protein
MFSTWVCFSRTGCFQFGFVSQGLDVINLVSFSQGLDVFNLGLFLKDWVSSIWVHFSRIGFINLGSFPKEWCFQFGFVSQGLGVFNFSCASSCPISCLAYCSQFSTSLTSVKRR